MTQPDLITLVDEGLGNTAYLVDLGDQRALAVDVSRDLRALRAATAARGLTVAYAADTHLHADFLSGAVQLAADEGTRILAPRRGGREFQHRGLDDGDEVDLGGLTLRAIGTPGHTDEHLAFLLLDGPQELGVFSGGSLIAGSAARVDLVAPERTEELARAQYRSVHRLAGLDPGTALWPTHGGGSFCSTAAGPAAGTTTIGDQRSTNRLLLAPDEDTFVRLLVETLGSHPPYFHRLGESNRRGPEVLALGPVLEALQPEAVAELRAAGAEIVDVRPVASFARAHPTGALSVPLRPAFASWLGWLAPCDRPLVILREEGQDDAEILWQALKIGYDNIVGQIAGGIDAWDTAGQPTTTIGLVPPAELSGARVLDVRQDSEYTAGHLPGATHVELGDLVGHAGDYADGPVIVMCGHGERAMGAASLLARAGATGVRVLDGGPHEAARALALELVPGL